MHRSARRWTAAKRGGPSLSGYVWSRSPILVASLRALSESDRNSIPMRRHHIEPESSLRRIGHLHVSPDPGPSQIHLRRTRSNEQQSVWEQQISRDRRQARCARFKVIGAYLHTLDASEVKPDDQLGDMYRRITCRSREVCCQHTWRITFRSLVTPCLAGKEGKHARERCASPTLRPGHGRSRTRWRLRSAARSC